MDLDLSQYDYHLPETLIANMPASPRDHSRLLVLDRVHQTISHKHFFDLPELLTPNDVLVLNQTKVIPARLYGHKESGGKVEILLLRQIATDSWEAICKPGLNLGQLCHFYNSGDITFTGTQAPQLNTNPEDVIPSEVEESLSNIHAKKRALFFSQDDSKIRNSHDINQSSSLNATVTEQNKLTGEVALQFNLSGTDLILAISEFGHTPIPPYIHSRMSETELRKSYQTIYAKQPGSAAAPTAGLHFTQGLLNQLIEKGIQIEYVTLHVGPGTFQRLRPENIRDNKLHLEHYSIDQGTAQRLNQAKKSGKRIVAVGTTTTRTLESSCRDTPRRVSMARPQLKSGPGTTQLFINPPYQYQFVDALITNFHLPQSSLLMLVSAFTTMPQSPEIFNNFATSFIGQAYQTAVENNYRFFSFGDAMMIE